MTSTAMPATCAAISCVVHPSQALTASGAVLSIAVRNASASRLRSTTTPSPRLVLHLLPPPMLKAHQFGHDRIIFNQASAAASCRLRCRPGRRPGSPYVLGPSAALVVPGGNGGTSAWPVAG